MGTRSGDIDPAIIFYLLQRGFSAVEIEETLNKKSGLLGVSEISGDVRDLSKYKAGRPAIRVLNGLPQDHQIHWRIFCCAYGLDCIAAGDR